MHMPALKKFILQEWQQFFVFKVRIRFSISITVSLSITLAPFQINFFVSAKVHSPRVSFVASQKEIKFVNGISIYIALIPNIPCFFPTVVCHKAVHITLLCLSSFKSP